MLKPRPTRAAMTTSGLNRPVSAAMQRAQVASSSTSTSEVSGMLSRSMATLTGVTAMARLASNPVVGPDTRRTR